MSRQVTQKIELAVVTKGKEVAKIGRAVVMQPKIQYKGTGIKWFDDARLVKKGGVG